MTETARVDVEETSEPVPMTYRERKVQRVEYYHKFVHGWKLTTCNACNGSGRYDSHGSPKCQGCDGTGKERVSPKEYQERLKWNL